VNNSFDASLLRGELLRNEPLARHTTWKVGGPARYFFRPADKDDLIKLLNQLPKSQPLLWLGLGSNLLVRDGGFDGIVISLTKFTSDLIINKNLVSVGAGVTCAKVAREAARAGLKGATFLAGIPGTIGGALAMNAGAYGGEIWDFVENVEVINRKGVYSNKKPKNFSISYRNVEKKNDEWFLRCDLKFNFGDSQEEQNAIRKLLKKRSEDQPTGKPSGGSTFRNPEGDFAARLVEETGLKGFQIGGAEVSKKHANFVLNKGNASAADIENLIEYMRAEVERKHGISLQTEVHIVGVSK
tara:strand:+ start:14090 stop:14986 length:897 start_codon:yes stop_codon:yes gene_type:complete